MNRFSTLPFLRTLLLLAATRAACYGQGFAPIASPWAVPTTSGNAQGYHDHYSFGLTINTRGWGTFDLNGDARPDLVTFGVAPRTSGGPSVFGNGSATPYWEVYLNTGNGFSPTAPWPVPTTSGMPDGYAWHNTSTTAPGGRWWDTFDLNGDGRPDLVTTTVTDASQNQTVFGGIASPYWEVYLNTGSGFAPTATHWPVPATAGTARGYCSTYSTRPDPGACRWRTLDLNGDARPDLVVTARNDTGGLPAVFGAYSAPHWEVYLNTGSGFAPTATTWRVPSIASTVRNYYDTSADGNVEGERSWSTVDLNGDARPDLVTTAVVPSSGGRLVFGSSAAPYWEVYLNTGQGFAATATSWPVPPTSGTMLGYNSLLNSETAAVGQRLWRTADLNGDTRPDLVTTAVSVANGTPDGAADVFGAGTSAPHWEVYLNTGSGFAATATPWAVPATAGTPHGYSFVYGEAETAGVRKWYTFDLNGETYADLVTTSIGNANNLGVVFGNGTTTPRWEVYWGTATGITSTATGSALTSVEVYPNPTTGTATLTTLPAQHGTPYRLLDGLGRVVATGVVASTAQSLDLQGLATGVYIVQLQTPTPRCLRIVKQ